MAEMNGARVLVVDDEIFFRKVLGSLLQKNGLQVVAEAADGDEAVDLYRQHVPDLVLMDIYMPGKSGIDATRLIMALDPTAKIIVCSGSGFDDDAAAALQAGARGVISKPFFDDEVLAAISGLLAG